MGFELGRLVREAAGEIGTRVAEKARELRRRAHAQAGRVWRDVGVILRLDASPEVHEASGCDASGREANTMVGPSTRAVVETMAEVLALSGYVGVHADVEGRPAPSVIRGTMRSHRPSLSATSSGRQVLVDVFVPEETDASLQLSRWQLFASAADQSGGEFHVVVPAWFENSGGRDWVRRIAEATGMRIAKVWEI